MNYCWMSLIQSIGNISDWPKKVGRVKNSLNFLIEKYIGEATKTKPEKNWGNNQSELIEVEFIGLAISFRKKK